MTAQWVKYDGSDEQIAEIKANTHGYIVRNIPPTTGFILSPRIRYDFELWGISETNFEYLICDPHPYADMICQWARTGQPVWVKVDRINDWGRYLEGEYYEPGTTITEYYDPTVAPDWNIPGAEYSFTPFEEEV